MTARRPSPRQRRHDAPRDIVDAEFEIVAPTKAATTVQDRSDAPAGLGLLAPQAPERVSMLSGRRAGVAFWGVGLGLALAAFWMSGGHAVLHGASGRSTAGEGALTLSDVTSRVDSSGTKPVLFVDGLAGNDGASRADLPGLEIRVAGLDGSLTRYKLGTSRRSLAPGERFAFSSRLDVPKNGVGTVSVRFTE